MAIAVLDAEPTFHEAAESLRNLRGREHQRDFVYLAQSAVRAAMLAVERELGSVAGVGGLRPRITWDQPRLIPRLELLESQLSAALVSLWGVRSSGGASATRALEVLAAELPRLASELFLLVHESMIEPGGLD